MRDAEAQGRQDYAGEMHLGFALYYALGKNDPAKGEEECKIALKLNARLGQAHALLGKIYLDAQKMSDAERELKAGLAFERWKDQTLIIDDLVRCLALARGRRLTEQEARQK